jgi:hypothetical protein
LSGYGGRAGVNWFDSEGNPCELDIRGIFLDRDSIGDIMQTDAGAR